MDEIVSAFTRRKPTRSPTFCQSGMRELMRNPAALIFGWSKAPTVQEVCMIMHAVYCVSPPWASAQKPYGVRWLLYFIDWWQNILPQGGETQLPACAGRGREGWRRHVLKCSKSEILQIASHEVLRREFRVVRSLPFCSFVP